MIPRWLAVGVPDSISHGGSQRARHVFTDLIRSTDAGALYRPDVLGIRRLFPDHLSALMPGAKVAAAELLPLRAIGGIRRLFDLRVLDFHDHPVHQLEALGVAADSKRRRYLQRLTDANVDAFDRILVISSTFADLSEVDPQKRVLIPNGTDTALIQPQPWPDRPRIGMVSGAAPGRGIELLTDAFRLVKREVPEATLHLALVGTDASSARYLRALRSASTNSAVTIHEVPYLQLAGFLGGMATLVIPHPKGAYMDSALPVKLFDSMAAGRPIVATPRIETAKVLAEAKCGYVTASDRSDDLAATLVRALTDETEARRMGNNARSAAVSQFDWQVLAKRVSAAVLG